MGADLSEGYDHVQPSFDSGFWKVHSARNKTTRLPESLWLLDRRAIRHSVKSGHEVEEYLARITRSVLAIRKIHHPNILKINEISDFSKKIAFASEPVEGSLASDKFLTTDDIIYVGDQVIHALEFLHEKAELIHLSLSPDSVCVNKALEAKICSFMYATPISSLTDLPPFKGPSPLSQILWYAPPERVQDKGISTSSDVFAWAAVFLEVLNKHPFYNATSIDDHLKQIEETPANFPTLCAEEMGELFKACLARDSSARPSISQIIRSKAFLQLSVRTIRQFDALPTRPPAEKWDFYKGFRPLIRIFSDRMLQFKIAPFLISELLNDVRFGSLLVPVLFTIGKRFSRDVYLSVILIPVKPPQYSYSHLNVSMRIAIL
jgi:SCY1-like protein 2